MFSQNWVCLVWKRSMDSVEVFSTLPDLPNFHIMKKKIKNIESIYIYIYIFLYLHIIGVRGSPEWDISSLGTLEDGAGQVWGVLPPAPSRPL